MSPIDLITTLSHKTVKLIKDKDIINKVIDENDYILISNLIKKYRHKDIQVTQDHILQLAENGLLILWSELIKYILVLTIAYLLHIFIATFFIMNVFSGLRGIAGGNHMSTFNKCFGVMVVAFLSLGFLINHIHIGIGLMIIGYILSLLIAAKYAPLERPDKSDKDSQNGNRMKKLSVVFVSLSLCISLVLFSNHALIANSITLGVWLEMFTVTPIGVRFFTWIDGR